MRYFNIVLAFLFLLASCDKKGKPSLPDPGFSCDTVEYAKGFTISESGGCTRLSVTNPWQQAENVNYVYLLGKNEHCPDKSFPEIRYIRVPVHKVVCLSTTFVGFINFLNKTGTIAGISGKQYVTDQTLAEKINHDEIPDVGYDDNLDYEKLIQIQPDVVFIYGVTGSVSTIVARLDELGIKSVVIAEYLEETALAKMEWIKYIGAFYGERQAAGTKFDSVANRYIRLEDMASKEKHRPTVLLGMPWNGTWYISGGRSYVAHLIEDAGGDYVWRDLPFKDSRPVSLEAVFEKAYLADVWLNSGDAVSREDILKVDQRFGRLNAFKNNAVYNNNNLLNSAGGNAYFEQGVVQPDVILADIISVLHPHLLPSYSMKYYRKLE
jgi:iron complex transport system substrate-binding protein